MQGLGLIVIFAFSVRAKSMAIAVCGVLLARDISVEKALEKVERAYAKLDLKL